MIFVCFKKLIIATMRISKRNLPKLLKLKCIGKECELE
jgi:hypothetical protein